MSATKEKNTKTVKNKRKPGPKPFNAERDQIRCWQCGTAFVRYPPTSSDEYLSMHLLTSDKCRHHYALSDNLGNREKNILYVAQEALYNETETKNNNTTKDTRAGQDVEGKG
jgi:hypothetical protein